ncbi:hypothetical protein [Photobacterium andalusiense]|uniref:Uncharacterized protein n=1 Tax=Photobacterium andalusiense TaxID=2204296 RepID=A0A1Y6MEY5_9GAMM|nr:hypothetical protein [Photobacterium andalusiense]SMY34340.1 hypothetical protein PAND9192_01279 [Photobacterium andalusiense]
MNISQKNKDNFFNLVDSLKKCRRADLSDVSKSKDVIEKLYVDPLDNDLILKSISKLNTTILTGRRGTGKSTIIARLQHDIRKSKDRLSLYIDVKSIFEQSKAFSYSAENYADHFSAQDLNKYLIYKSFLKEIISEIKLELKTNTLKFYLAKITDYFGPDKTAFEEELNRIFDDIEKFEYMDVEVLKQKKVLSNEENKNSVNQKVTANVSVDASGPKGGFNAEYGTSNSDASSLNEEFSEVLLKCFNPILIMRNIRELLKKIGINHVFICLDDFSEIDYDAMKIFVDVIIGPLNNLSDEFFKFKIAAYPDRIYLGDIDPQKIEQIRLDFYELYQAKTITDVHAQAQGSIKKLIEKRTQFFCKQTPDEFFDTTKTTLDDYYKALFDITSCVPRNVGWILWYANQQSIAKDKKITLNDLSIAAEKHFIDTVRPYFSQNQFMREPFDMKLEKYHLHQLLERFVNTAKINKRDILVSDSKVFAKDKTKPPTSHFYINKKLEDVLKPLEMQFFITKYNEQKDQDSSELMSFFSFNYGLCVSEDIHYGRGSDRKYVIQRRFNNTKSLQGYLADAKHIACNNHQCKATHDYEMLPMIEMFDMLCPKCKTGTCSVEHANVDVELADEKILLSEFDMQFINSLKVDSPQYPSGLAQELDCTYQKVGKRAARLKDMGFLQAQEMTINKALGKRNYYSLTDEAVTTYFEQ